MMDGILLTMIHFFLGWLSLFYDMFRGRWVNRFPNIPNMEGSVAVVTGGERGIGKALVIELVKAGTTVIVGDRNPDLMDDFKKELQNCKGKAYFQKLDTSDMKSVEDFAKNVEDNYDKVNILVNNAGVYKVPYSKTKDNFEIRLATNYLGHFKLTHLLSKSLERGASDNKKLSRVVNVSSCAHYAARINWDDMNWEENNKYETNVYGHSKLAQVLFSNHLNKYLENQSLPIRSFSVHPGIVGTDMLAHYGFLRKMFKSTHEAATSILYAAISPDLEGKGGLYLANCRPGSQSRYAQNEENQKRLFEWTCKKLEIVEFGRVNWV